MPKREPALSNPTHKIVGPDGTEYFLIRQTRNTLRIKILFSTVDYIKGHVSEGYGPSAADAVMMGSWIGPLRYHFGAALDCLPDGAHCVVVNPPEASLYDYQTSVIWSGWNDYSMDGVRAALSRADARCGGRDSLPVTRPDLATAKAKVEAHKAALLDGSYRREDGPMILNTAPQVPGVAYYPTYVRGVGTPVPADLVDAFVSDADAALAYIAFMESIPPMPVNPRTRPATPQELRDFAQYATWTFKPEPLRAYARQVVETGTVDLVAAEAAERERIRQANIETERRRQLAPA